MTGRGPLPGALTGPGAGRGPSVPTDRPWPNQGPCPATLAASLALRAPPLQEVWLLNRERELKEEIRKDRDKDIELVVRRLEADMTLAREESERAAESR